jgi:hypothetical protein
MAAPRGTTAIGCAPSGQEMSFHLLHFTSNVLEFEIVGTQELVTLRCFKSRLK